MNYWLFLTPLFSALIGWGIHKIAIRSLLHSSRSRQRLAEKIGKLAASEIASLDLEEKIGDPANFKKLVPVIEDHVDDFLRNKLKEQMPMISMFIGDKTINTLKTVFMQELESLFPQVMKQFATNLKNDPGIEQMISSKLLAMSPQKLEKMLSKQLRYAEMLGAITGFVAGLLQVIFILLMS
jgi:uncharacterized membrane protein YheB (UPF0754 family)